MVVVCTIVDFVATIIIEHANIVSVIIVIVIMVIVVVVIIVSNVIFILSFLL